MRHCRIVVITLCFLCGCQSFSDEKEQTVSYRDPIGEGLQSIRIAFDSGFSQTKISYLKLDSAYTTFNNRILNTDELVGFAGGFHYRTNLDTIDFECELTDMIIENSQKYHFRIPIKNMVAISFNFLPGERDLKKELIYKAFDHEYLYE